MEKTVFLIRNVSLFDAGPMDENRNPTASQNPTKWLGKKLLDSQVPLHLHIQNPSMLTASIDHQWMSLFYCKLPLYLSYFASRISATGGQFSFTPLPFGSSCFGSNLSRGLPAYANLYSCCPRSGTPFPMKHIKSSCPAKPPSWLMS